MRIKNLKLFIRNNSNPNNAFLLLKIGSGVSVNKIIDISNL